VNEQRLALFVLLGQAASREMRQAPDLVPPESLKVSATHDLAASMPDVVRDALDAAEVYKLFFAFETYLRELILGALTDDGKVDWWPKVPKDVQDEVTKMEETEETKSWMALGSRNKSLLLTYPQFLRIIDHCWKDHFEDLIRDKALVQQARLIGHLRNAICHMSIIPDEEKQRIRQTMRDWFRRVAP
jgi:hypothetical protein